MAVIPHKKYSKGWETMENLFKAVLSMYVAKFSPSARLQGSLK